MSKRGSQQLHTIWRCYYYSTIRAGSTFRRKNIWINWYSKSFISALVFKNAILREDTWSVLNHDGMFSSQCYGVLKKVWTKLIILSQKLLKEEENSKNYKENRHPKTKIVAGGRKLQKVKRKSSRSNVGGVGFIG